MIKVLFDVILSILTFIIQVICLPINALINVNIPDLAPKMEYVASNLSTIFTGVTWGLGVIPPVLLTTLLFILSVEVARHTIYVSYHGISLVLEVIQKLKFW